MKTYINIILIIICLVIQAFTMVIRWDQNPEDDLSHYEVEFTQDERYFKVAVYDTVFNCDSITWDGRIEVRIYAIDISGNVSGSSIPIYFYKDTTYFEYFDSQLFVNFWDDTTMRAVISIDSTISDTLNLIQSIQKLPVFDNWVDKTINIKYFGKYSPFPMININRLFRIPKTGDVDGDGKIDIYELQLFDKCLGHDHNSGKFRHSFDFNRNLEIDLHDLIKFDEIMGDYDIKEQY